MSGQQGAISSISFCIVGGNSINLGVTGISGTAVFFRSSAPDVVAHPSAGIVGTNGFLSVSTTTTAVTEDTTVTITASTLSPHEKNVPYEISMIVFIKAAV